MFFPRKDLRETKLNVADVSYVSLCPFGRCSDTTEQRTWINSVCLNILIPFVFCFPYCWWTWDFFFIPAWCSSLPGANEFKYSNNSCNSLWGSLVFSLPSNTDTQKGTRVLGEVFLLVHWSLQLWNSLQNNHLQNNNEGFPEFHCYQVFIKIVALVLISEQLSFQLEGSLKLYFCFRTRSWKASDAFFLLWQVSHRKLLNHSTLLHCIVCFGRLKC